MAHFLRDPALEGPAWLEQALLGPLSAVGLPKLAGVAHITIIACAASFALQAISSFLSPLLFPKTYPKIKMKQDDWDLHVVCSNIPRRLTELKSCGADRNADQLGGIDFEQVGWVYALIATPLAISMILHPSKEIVADRLYGYGLAEGRLSALAVGYFIWDAFVSAKHIKTQVSIFAKGCYHAC